MSRHLSARRALPAIAPLALLLATAAAPSTAVAGGYQVTNLVSNTPGVAPVTDPDLINPWGISYGPSGPFWVSNNNSGTSTFYNSAGTKLGLTVTIPAIAAGLGAPTGQVFNGSTDFGGNSFLFATEDGSIAAWKGSDGTTATLAATTNKGADYTGIAIDGHDLFVANAAGGLDVYDSSFHALSTITDPNAGGSSPFNVQNIAGTLYVTYTGAGGNFLDSYDPTSGAFTRMATGGPLDAAWGLALAPTGFGEFGGDLLVGNFGNGEINAFSTAGTFEGSLTDLQGHPLAIPGLWGLTFGNGGAGGKTGSLYFAAGGPTESSGLLGQIDPSPVPEASTTVSFGLLLALGLCGSVIAAKRRKQSA